MQNITQLIPSNHLEIIHDISFNHYGDRFATCSSDQKIVFYEKDKDGKWEPKSELRCHDGPVWRIKWAHPQFGSIIATCSHDKKVNLYEERCSMQEETNSFGTKELRIKREWTNVQSILETKESVADIKFGKRQAGLVLAIAYGDGQILTYSAQRQNLQEMDQTGNFNGNLNGIKSISWNKNILETDMLAVGGYDYNTRYRKPEGLAIMKGPIYGPSQPNSDNDKGQESTLSIFIKSENKWNLLKQFEEMKVTINDVSWANSNGRSFHLIALADQKGVKVIKFTLKKYMDKNEQYNIELLEIIQLDQQQDIRTAYRVCWNILATTLAASFDKQEVRIYKKQGNIFSFYGLLKEQQEKIQIKSSQPTSPQNNQKLK